LVLGDATVSLGVRRLERVPQMNRRAPKLVEDVVVSAVTGEVERVAGALVRLRQVSSLTRHLQFTPVSECRLAEFSTAAALFVLLWVRVVEVLTASRSAVDACPGVALGTALCATVSAEGATKVGGDVGVAVVAGRALGAVSWRKLDRH
jgi:hypothetical protein